MTRTLAVLAAAGFVAYALWNQQWAGLGMISFLTEQFGGMTYANGGLTNDGWEALYRGPIVIGIPGALAGLVIWLIAYRKPRTAV